MITEEMIKERISVIESDIEKITKEISDTEKEFENSQYGEFKIAVAETVIDYLDPIKKNFDDLTSDNLEDIVVSNLKSAKDSAQKTIIEVEEALGIS